MGFSESLFRPLDLAADATPAPVSSNNYCLSDGGKFFPGNSLSTTPEQMDAAFDKWDATNGAPLVVFFHGGLVTESVGYSNAQNLITPYTNAGGYPYFFIWRSGFLETIGDSLQAIFSNPIFAHMIEFVVDHVERQPKRAQPMALAATGIATMPRDDSDWVSASFASQVKSDVQSDKVFQSVFARTSPMHALALQFAPTRTTTGTMTNEAVIQHIQAALSPPTTTDGVHAMDLTVPNMLQFADKIVQIVGAVIRRESTGRSHPGVCTVTEEVLRAFFLGDVGKNLWQTMKDDCTNAFGQDTSACVGTRFLENLTRRYGKGATPRVVVIGHSAGAIYAMDFIRAAQRTLPAEAQFDVILMAAACRFDLFNQTLQTAGDRIRNIRSFAMLDAYEQKNTLIQWPGVPETSVLNQLLGSIYPASLLYFISGLLEPEQDGDDPLVGMQRFLQHNAVLDALPNVTDVEKYLEMTGDNREVFSPTSVSTPTAPLGMTCGATSHGGFPIATLDSTVALIRKWQP